MSKFNVGEHLIKKHTPTDILDYPDKIIIEKVLNELSAYSISSVGPSKIGQTKYGSGTYAMLFVDKFYDIDYKYHRNEKLEKMLK